MGATFPGRGFEDLRSLPVVATEPQRLIHIGIDQVQGYYGAGQIRLSNQLSRRMAFIVIAHELGHAWHDRHHPAWAKVDDFVAEGFAEWVAFQALRLYGDGASAYNVRSSHDATYGEGLRFFLEMEKKGKSDLVFEIAAQWMNKNGERHQASASDDSRLPVRRGSKVPATPAPPDPGGSEPSHMVDPNSWAP